MSRVAKDPVKIPSGVDVKLDGAVIDVKGRNGDLSLTVHSSVEVNQDDEVLRFSAIENDREGWALAGTMRALVQNMILGVSEGFEKRLQLNGVGYRAKASGNTLNLTVGFSHTIDYTLPEGVTAETPSQTEILLKAADKQLLGKVAAEVRAFRPPEPYKGKGIRYADEYVRRKEAKKK